MTSKGWSVHDEWLYPCHQHVYAPITRRVADLCHQHVYAPITWRVVVPVLPACLRPYYMASGCTCATSMETPLLHDEWLFLPPACLRPYYTTSGCTCATSMSTPAASMAYERASAVRVSATVTRATAIPATVTLPCMYTWYVSTSASARH